MGSLLRSGGPVVMGLIGVSVAMLSVGLAVVALEEDDSITLGAIAAFIVAGVFFLAFLAATTVLWWWDVVRKRKVRELVGLHRDGRATRQEIMHGPAPASPVDAYEQWAKDVLAWLEANEPDHLPGFTSAVPGVTTDYPNAPKDGSRAINMFDSHLSALVDVLRDIRTAQ